MREGQKSHSLAGKGSCSRTYKLTEITTGKVIMLLETAINHETRGIILEENCQLDIERKNIRHGT